MISSRKHASRDQGQDLTVGLHTITEINQSIRYADAKAGALAALLALVTSVLATRSGPNAGGRGLAVLLCLCLLAVLLSVALLTMSQIPRVRPSGGLAVPNRVSFPSLAGMPAGDILCPRTPERQIADVWQQAAELSGIAVQKYRWLRRAMVSTLMTLFVALLWLALSTWPG